MIALRAGQDCVIKFDPPALPLTGEVESLSKSRAWLTDADLRVENAVVVDSLASSRVLRYHVPFKLEPATAL
jgi:hypothetical protein